MQLFLNKIIYEYILPIIRITIIIIVIATILLLLLLLFVITIRFNFYYGKLEFPIHRISQYVLILFLFKHNFFLFDIIEA